MMEPYDKQLEIAADREFQSDVENGRRLVAESNQPDNLKTRTEEWKKSIPHTLPPDADYDYMSMVRDGKQPSMSHKPADWNDAEQGEWKPEPVFLPHEYYRGSLVTSRKGGTGRLVQKQYNLNSGKMELSLPFSRVVARGIEDIGTGLVNMAYDAGTLAALPVDVAKETAKAAARSTPFTAGAMAKMDVEAGTPERERPTLGAMFDSWENAAAEGRLDEYQNTPWEIARDDMFERYDWERPKIGDTEVYGLGEEMSSLMLTIVGDFAIGGKMAGQRSVSADAGKLKAFTEMLIDNLKTGVYGEYLFSHVDEEGGNISSLLRDFGFDNAVTEALDTRGMDSDAMRIALNTAEGAMLSSLWHFAKITKDVALQGKIQARAAIVAGRIMENIGGGPVAGSPRAQRGAIGDLSKTGSGARSIGTHATAEEITQLDPGRPIYVAQSNPGELAGGINTRPVQHEVFLKPGAKQVNVMDEDLRMAWYDDAGEEAGYAKLRAKYPDADVLVGDNGTTLIMNPDMIELGAAIKQTPEQIAAARESMNQMRTFKMDEVLSDVEAELPSDLSRLEMAAESEKAGDTAFAEQIRGEVQADIAARAKAEAGQLSDGVVDAVPGNSIEIEGKTYTPQRVDKGMQLVMVDARQLDELWKQNKGNYVSADGENQIGNRVEQFKKYWDENDEISVGSVYFDPDRGLLEFGDGRHRARVMIDSGMEKIPVSMEPRQIEALQAELRGAVEPPSARAATIEPTGREMSFDERVGKYLTEDELAMVTPKTREVIQRLLTTSASPEEVASMAAAGGAKRGWYVESVAALRHIFGDDAERFAALLSATSPQTSVESNLRNALNIWADWIASGRKTDPESIIASMSRSVEQGDLAKMPAANLNKMVRRANEMFGTDIKGTKAEKIAGIEALSKEQRGRLSVLGAWENNSIRALRGEDPLTAGLSGPKVTSFMRNLAGIMKEVTQDTWMARALGMSQSRDFSGRNLKAFADEIGKLGQKKAGYLAGNILVREAADIMSRATGETWTPAEVQETVWSWAKAIYEAKGAKGETRNIPEILRSGEITDDVVRDTPDFATLFGQEGEFRRILENAGYGQQIKTLPASGFGSRSAVGLGPEGERALESAARRLDRTSRARRKGTSEDIYQWSRGLIRPVGDPGSTPGTFGRRNLRTGTGSLSDIPVTQFYLPKEKQAQLQKLGVPTPSLNEFSAPEKFHEFVSQAKANSKDTSGFLTLYSPEEYANMRTFVTSDGSAGFAIKPDGDIVSVFNNKAGPNKGISPHLISLAIEQGGTKLDAYDGILMDIYGDMGFVEVGRDKWNPKYKPDDWNEERFGTPDVVYMELQK